MRVEGILRPDVFTKQVRYNSIHQMLRNAGGPTEMIGRCFILLGQL